MKESKKRENSTSKKKKHNRSILNLDSWDQTDLEDADEKVLERRLHQLKLQLQMAQDETSHESRQSFTSKHKKKHISEEVTTEADSSDSESTVTSASSSSVHKYKSRKSSSFSGDDKKKYQRNLLPKKKFSKEIKASRSSTRSERENNSDSKTDKKFVVRRKVSPVLEKSSSRARSRKSPSLDKRDLYNRLDSGRWHDKAKEFEKERTKLHENDHDRIRGRSRIERICSANMQQDQRLVTRTKNKRKKVVGRTLPSIVSRRKGTPLETIRTRTAAYEAGTRRITVVTRKVSPRDERFGRHDERRVDLKVTRRNDVRSGDLRDVSVRVTRDIRDRKEPSSKTSEKPREREVLTKPHREIIDHNRLNRDRSKVIEDRFKDRDKRLHDRLESERNIRNVRNDVDDKFRRNDRIVEPPRVGNNRHMNESVFDRIRNRYNDRRNAENQRLGRDRTTDVRKDRPLDKEITKSRNPETNMNDRLIRERRTNLSVPIRARSLHRDRKEPERNVIERRSPVDFDKKFTNPLNTRKARETDNRVNVKRKSLENDDPMWSKKKGINKVRSRSHSSEKRKRRRSSQEEWRVIDMTSPVLDDEFSEENKCNAENNVQTKLKRTITNKLKSKSKNEEGDENENKNKSILTDELSDISDEDFNDVNSNNIIKNKKGLLMKNDKITENEKVARKLDLKYVREKNEFELDKTLTPENKCISSDVDDLINHQKITDESNERMDLEKGDHLDSEEETDLFTVSRVSDALGVDWADLVEESKKKISSFENETRNARRRWEATSVFAKIGVSAKYAGEDLFNDIQKDLAITTHSINNETPTEDNEMDENKQKILHPSPAIHVCMKNRIMKRRMLLKPYKIAISARKDIVIRRTLCGLPVKSLSSQQLIGICHWIV